MNSSNRTFTILAFTTLAASPLIADSPNSPFPATFTSQIAPAMATPSAMTDASPATAAPSLPVAPAATSASKLDSAPVWHPAAGDHAVNLSAFNGLTLGWMSWYSDHHSQEDLLSYSLNDSAMQSVEPNSWTTPANRTFSWGATYASIQRWRLKKLGNFGDLNVLAGPFLSYSYGYSDYAPGIGSIYQNIYGVGAKIGLDVEMFPVQGWSMQLGYLASGAWQDINYFTQNGSFPEQTGQYSILTVGLAAFQAGINYYFR